jgi:two-component system cell cycle response regulator DivK
MKKTILLVEDSKLQKLAGEKILLRAGFLVLLASNGEEGLRLARESFPDLILLDLRLPGIEGEHVLDSLKLDAQTRRIPVVIVSDLAPANAAKLKAAGAADYFEKSRFLGGAEGEIAFLAAIDGVLRESEVAKPAEKSSQPLARRQGA